MVWVKASFLINKYNYRGGNCFCSGLLFTISRIRSGPVDFLCLRGCMVELIDSGNDVSFQGSNQELVAVWVCRQNK